MAEQTAVDYRKAEKLLLLPSVANSRLRQKRVRFPPFALGINDFWRITW